MIKSIIRFSVKNKVIVMIGTLTLIISGIVSMLQLPVDAVPDITNNQVQIVTTSPSLAPQEVEQFITFPLENSMANIPNVTDIRSISRFGISVITIIFEDHISTKDARILVKEQLDLATGEIPPDLGQPQMMPVTTGLGEIYQYVLRVDPKYEYSPMELRTIQDWIVKKQLSGVKGIIDVSSFGGFLKQYQVSVDPYKLQSRNLTLNDVFETLKANNKNSGGSYIEKNDQAFYIRTEGLIRNLSDVENILIKEVDGTPVFIRDIGTAEFGSANRYGAMTMDGKGEAVGGITLMLKGANSSQTIENVQNRIERIQESLPEGVSIYPYLDRSVLVGKATHTVGKNLIEGGLIVIFVLVIFLGNWRAGLIVASVIPLSLLFAFILMNYFGVSANLMSLGAIDFGIVIDGAVIVVEGIIHLIYSKYVGQKLSQNQMDDVIVSTASRIIRSAAFGVLIILVVFLPIMTLTGIEGKMFVPMAQTVSFAIIGALLLSITYVPMMSALVLKKKITKTNSFSDKIIRGIQKFYQPILKRVLQVPKVVIGTSLLLFIGAAILFNQLGAEFIPTLEEGDLAMQVTIEPGSSLNKMVETTTEAEKILKDKFPEVKHVVSKIGTAEIPTDPMAVEDADVMILLKDKGEWVSANDREELASKMKKELANMKGVQFEFTQPIELRFNELISGSKNDLAIQLYGDDLDSLAKKAHEIEQIVRKIDGAGDVKVEQTEGLPQLIVKFNREKMALYNIEVDQLNQVIRTAYAGEKAGTIYEGQRRFDLTVRLESSYRDDLDLGRLFVTTPDGDQIPVSAMAQVEKIPGPMQISRENANRRISVGVNIRNRDIASFVEEAKEKITANVELPTGYYIEFGGQFENLTAAKERLMIAVPIALVLIFFFLFFAFKSFKYAFIIYITVPLSTIGGIVALYLRGMPFSISAGVGFIALFGVAVLNGIVLISYFNELKDQNDQSLEDVVTKGSLLRLRPVLMTAAVASLGFLPMAMATSAGAEVQKPLATVVIGGLISATLLTLLVLPVIYSVSHRSLRLKKILPTILLLFASSVAVYGQETMSLEKALDSAYQNNLEIQKQILVIETEKLNKQGSFALQNTDFNIQQGQINSSLNDYNISVNQSLGNPMSMLRYSQLSESKIEASKSKLALLKRDVRKQVTQTWLHCEFALAEIQLYSEYQIVAEKYLESLKIKVESGDESPVSLGLMQLRVRDLKQKSLIYSAQLNEQLIHLKLLTGIDGEIVFPKTGQLLNQFDPISSEKLELNSEFHQTGITLVKSIEQERRHIRSDYFPEITVGYFNQSLDNVRNFQGFQVSMSAPLFNRQQRIDLKKNAITTNYQETINASLISHWQSAFEHAVEHYNEVSAFYVENTSEYRKEIDFLSKASQTEYDSGNIDYSIYLQSQSQILDGELRLIELKQALIEAQIELNYYL